MKSIEALPKVYPSRWPAAPESHTVDRKYNYEGLSVTPVMVNGDHDFGAEIEGMDWNKPLPAKTVQQVGIPPVNWSYLL